MKRRGSFYKRLLTSKKKGKKADGKAGREEKKRPALAERKRKGERQL